MSARQPSFPFSGTACAAAGWHGKTSTPEAVPGSRWQGPQIMTGGLSSNSGTRAPPRRLLVISRTKGTYHGQGNYFVDAWCARHCCDWLVVVSRHLNHRATGRKNVNGVARQSDNCAISVCGR
jgi:hypothetical protein